METVPQTAREMLRHTVATLAYRAGKTIRGAPPEFASFKAASSTRTPAEILAHMGDLLDWALSMVRDKPVWNNSTPLAWEQEAARFFAALQAFDAFLASEAPLATPVTRAFQGPIADALTHTGQLAMLRRMSGAPMKGESYNRASIEIGRVGADQTPADPRYEFD
jgi:hypothetical protein